MIETVLYILAFCGGCAFFLYLLSLYHTTKDRRISAPRNSKKQSLIPQDKKPTPLHNQPLPNLKERICPLCGSKLNRYEALYASKVVKDSTKILIYGCRYCYKPDEDPDERKKSTI